LRQPVHTFGAEEVAFRRVIQVNCFVHSWMSGYVIVRDHPYVGITDESGTLEICNLPGGEWTFKVWQERSGYITRVRQKDVAANWGRGEVNASIRSGETSGSYFPHVA
jgi:hypothetical protein